MPRANPWDATDYRVGEKIEVYEKSTKKWANAVVQKTGGWRLIVAFPEGGAIAIDSPKHVRRRSK